ncbi:MAG TPA: hypothetical protein VLM87_01010 [Rubrivivax sp.]|nr:hypothetical protein [Rubrivivax sp.]
MHPLLIDFDGNVQSDDRLGIFESGLRFTGPYATTMVSWPGVNSQGAFNGTPTLPSYAYPMTMKRHDGQPFKLRWMDIGWYWLPDGRTSATLVAFVATLQRPDGSTGTQQLDQPWGDFQPWVLGETVTRVLFEQPYFTRLRYDNFDLLAPSPVPELPALWLALSGLAGLAAWRRGG